MIKQYNFPTTILFGRGAVEEAAQRIYNMKFRKPLLVADQGLVDLGIVDKISKTLHQANLEPVIFTEVHPNPIEDDVLKGASYYLDKKCDCVIALGGGSPMDAAKGIMIATTHEGPLAQYDDAIGGDKLLVNPMPKLFAIPTTAGTGSEVGRCGVITLKETNNKTIFFHPTLLPTIAILEPELTLGLPKSLTVATGIDAFTHSLEAYLAPGFHPLADGIALESMRLVIENLPLVATNGHDIVARGKMMMAALMGATAFQKGLGMIHSLAHPLSSECGLHHGLANALVGPDSIAFIESQNLNSDQQQRIKQVNHLFSEPKPTLNESLREFYKSLGINFGLRHHGVAEEKINLIGKKAFGDVCHKTNMIPVTEEQLIATLKAAF